MAQQTVHEFIQGKFGGVKTVTSISKQINDFLEAHPNHSIRCLDTQIGPEYTRAFVVFDIRESREPQQQKNGKSK